MADKDGPPLQGEGWKSLNVEVCPLKCTICDYQMELSEHRNPSFIKDVPFTLSCVLIPDAYIIPKDPNVIII